MVMKRLEKYRKYHALAIYALVAILGNLLFAAIKTDFNTWFADLWVGKCLSRIYESINGNDIVFVLSLLLLLLLLSSVCINEIKRNIWSYQRVCAYIGLSSLALQVLNDSYWSYTSVLWCKWNWGFCASIMIGISMSIFILGCVIKNIYLCIRNRKPEINIMEMGEYGFTDDSISEDIPPKIKSYTQDIANRILLTEKFENSFAVGISGAWGTGKTTYLKELQKALGNRVICKDFMPWNSQTPDKIIEDFFLMFRKMLARNVDASLEEPITKYAKHLLSINRMDPWIALFRSAAILYSEEDSNTLKEQISEALSGLNKKIVICIDDIDRLDHKELFEVLRLIRNTANLPNLVYIVTYDKSYIVSELAQKGINDPAGYLEKIISVEVMLPKVTRFEVIKVLNDDLRKMIGQQTENTLSDVVNDFKNASFTLTHLICNFRDAKRFARQLAVHVNFAIKNLSDDIDIKELFWLEVIRYVDYGLYSILSSDPSRILKWTSKGVPNIAALQDEYASDEKENDRKNKIAKYELNILQYLFDLNRPKDKNSVVFSNNYSRYFLLNIEENKLYQQDLESILVCNIDDVERQLEVWFGENTDKPRDIEPLLFLIRNKYVSKLSISEWTHYFELLLALSRYASYNKTMPIIKAKFCLLDDEVADLEEKKRFVIEFIEKLIKEDLWTFCAKLLKELLNHGVLINEENAIMLMRHNFNLFAEKKHPDAIDVIDEKTIFSQLRSICSYSWEIEDTCESGWTSYLREDIYAYFSQHPSSRIEEFETYFSIDPTEEEKQFGGYNRDEKLEQVQTRIERIFGDDSLNEYKIKCFVQPQRADVEKQILDKAANSIIQEGISAIRSSLLNKNKRTTSKKSKPKPSRKKKSKPGRKQRT